MARAILFDLNGVIEDVTPFLEVRDDLIVSVVKSLASEAAIRQTASKIRMEYDTVMSSNLAEFHLMFWDDLLSQLAVPTRDELLLMTYEKFVESYLPVSRVFPDTRDLLHSLQSDFEFGVLSNANSFRARSFLKYHALDKLFKSILISHDTPYAKPDKEIFLLAAQRFGKRPSDVIMIGDRVDNDIHGAKDAGMIPILLDRTGVSTAPNLDCMVITTLDDLKESIREVANGQLDQKTGSHHRRTTRVVIVCGGKGSRLKTQLGDRQKCLAVVKGKPILFHTVDALISAGLKDFDLVAGDSATAVQDAIQQCDRYAPYRFRVLPISAPSTGRAIQEYWRDKEDEVDVVYSHGNIIVDPLVVKQFIKDARAKTSSDVTLLSSPEWSAENHAALIARNGIIEEIVTNPSEHRKGNLCSVGLAFVKGSAELDEAEIDEHGMFEDLVEVLRYKNRLRVSYCFSDRSWEHLGVPKDWARLAVEG
jgi:HAD superfamily hydrolase (TIGR01509 family)